MVSPTKRSVDIPIENGFVGMVDREEFDEFLRDRAQDRGVTLYRGTFEKVDRTSGNPVIEYFSHDTKQQEHISAKLIIGADGARSKVAKAEVPGAEKIPYVIAYHEIINAPKVAQTIRGTVVTSFMTALFHLTFTDGYSHTAKPYPSVWERVSVALT